MYVLYIHICIDQDILEKLKTSSPGGPIDSSLFHEVERLRQENAELQGNNTDLQATVNTVQVYMLLNTSNAH